MRTVLTGDAIPELCERLDQLPRIDVARQPHAASISSRTKCRRINLGAGAGPRHRCIDHYTLTVLKLLSGDPLPQKSAWLFTPEMNPLTAQDSNGLGPAPMGISYLHAMNLLRARKAQRQAAMALTGVKICRNERITVPFSAMAS